MLRELVRRDLLLPDRSAVLAGEEAFRFRHALIRDAAYVGAAQGDPRSELHERHADWLEGLGVAVPEADARIGFHLEQAPTGLRPPRSGCSTTAPASARRSSG